MGLIFSQSSTSKPFFLLKCLNGISRREKSRRQAQFQYDFFHFISISISFVFFCIARINKSVPDKMKLKIKDGAAVDPESGYNL